MVCGIEEGEVLFIEKIKELIYKTIISPSATPTRPTPLPMHRGVRMNVKWNYWALQWSMEKNIEGKLKGFERIMIRKKEENGEYEEESEEKKKLRFYYVYTH